MFTIYKRSKKNLTVITFCLRFWMRTVDVIFPFCKWLIVPSEWKGLLSFIISVCRKTKKNKLHYHLDDAKNHCRHSSTNFLIKKGQRKPLYSVKLRKRNCSYTSFYNQIYEVLRSFICNKTRKRSLNYNLFYSNNF